MKIVTNLKNIFFIAISTLFLGCSTIPLDLDFDATNYDTFIAKALKKIPSKLKYLKESSEVVLVTSFVNIDRLENYSKLGFLLTSTLKDNLVSKYDMTVREASLNQNFEMGNQGLRVLTRDQEKIDKNIYSENYSVVGTYTITSKQLIVFIQVIDIYTGHVLASTTNRTRITTDIKSLESSSINVEKQKRVYAPLVL